MRGTGRIRATVVAGVITLALVIPVLTPAADVIPGTSSITTQVEAKAKLSIKAAKKRLKNVLRSDGYPSSYRVDYFKTYPKTYAFGITNCTSSGCETVGYAEVNKYTGKVRYEMGDPD